MERPKGKFRCMACGQVWQSSDLFWEPSRNVWACGDLACGANVRKVSDKRRFTLEKATWVNHLTQLLNECQDEDVIIVHSPEQAELAERARGRMFPDKQITFEVAAAEDRPLERMIERVEELAEGHQEPDTMCWFNHDDEGEWIYTHYCPPCSKKMEAWLLGGSEPEEGLSPHAEHPKDWRGKCTKDNLTIYRSDSIECEAPEHCALCGRRLSVSLLTYAAKYEVDHFESLLQAFQSGESQFEMSPNEWFAVLEMMEAIQYVEDESRPDRYNKQTYDRVVETVKGLLAMVGAKELFSETDLDYLKEPERTDGQLLQAEMLRLQATGQYASAERLWEDAAANLGNENGRFDRFFVCLECGRLYHGDYSSNSDPDRDFCKGECEVAWVLAHPDEPYNGEHFPQDEEE